MLVQSFCKGQLRVHTVTQVSKITLGEVQLVDIVKAQTFVTRLGLRRDNQQVREHEHL
jgi:hypothetical protein